MKIFYIDSEKYVLDKDFLKTFLKDRKFSSYKKEREHCYGRFLIKTVGRKFFNIENTELEIVNKKPKFKLSDIQFSISHSENIIVAAFDKNPVGVDIEIMKSRNFPEIFARYNVKGIEITKEMFYQYWTEYEAKIKLQGEVKTKLSTPFLNNFMLSVSGDFDEKYEIYEVNENGFNLIYQ